MLSRIKLILSWTFRGHQNRTKIHDLPDEVLLHILAFLKSEELLYVVARVCKRWKELSKDPKLWRNRSVSYDREKPQVLSKCLRSICVLGCLNLGGHENLHRTVIQSFSHSELKSVKKLKFLSSCRTPPEHVISILETLAPTLESLTICLNDELVSYGRDGKTCYERNNVNRPGILFGLVGNIVNLKYLKLRGGYTTLWYHNEIYTSLGCNRLETLDLKDFEEIVSKETSKDDIMLVEALIRKNSNTLKSLKVPTMNFKERDAVLSCKRNLVELGVSATQMIEILDQMTNILALHINGRVATSRAVKQRISDFIRTSVVMRELLELSLVHFNDPHNIILPAIASTCTKLRVFRSKKNVLCGEGISFLVRNVTHLEALLVPHTYAISESHLNLVPSYLPNLIYLDLTGNGFLDCMESIKELHRQTNKTLQIKGTSECLFSHSNGPIHGAMCFVPRKWGYHG